MEIVALAFFAILGLGTFFAVLHLVAALAMLCVPLSPQQSAALVQRLREEQAADRECNAPERARMLAAAIAEDAKIRGRRQHSPQ